MNDCAAGDQARSRLSASGPLAPEALQRLEDCTAEHGAAAAEVGLYPIVTSQYSATILGQVSYHIQSLFF